jgi:transcriptional regulator with XRE-family HTH domain
MADKETIFNVDSFSSRLLMKRVVKKRISMREAAEQIGISAATLSRLENKNIPDVYTYYACCKW